MEIKLFVILITITHLNSNGPLLISMVDMLRAKTSLNTLWDRTQAKEVPCRGSYSSQGRSPSYAKNGNRTKIASPLRPLASKSTIDEYFISRKLSSLEVCADRGQLVSIAWRAAYHYAACAPSRRRGWMYCSALLLMKEAATFWQRSLIYDALRIWYDNDMDGGS